MLSYPLALTGAIAAFGLASSTGLGIVSANMGSLIAPVAVRPDFNLPPVTQIGSLTPPARAAEPQPAQAAESASSIVDVAPPGHTVAVALEQPAVAPAETLAAPNRSTGRVGAQAVNVRAAASKSSSTVGVLQAGTPVNMGENRGGWIYVTFAGGDGWVYSDFLETGSTASITVFGGQ
ncbi:MAG TPA: SH3 domain-containing protein [Devosia sp.]|nr:SH3 domain-containing protein [Devosia sp.]